MSFFNRAIDIKQLWNKINIFYQKTVKNEQRLYLAGNSHCITDIEAEYKKVFESS